MENTPIKVTVAVTMLPVSFAAENYARGTLTAVPDGAAIYVWPYLAINGGGSVTTLQNGESLVAGQTYDMTANPGDGFVFSGWQPLGIFTLTQFTLDGNGNSNPNSASTLAEPGPVYSTQPNLEFTMQPVTMILDVPGDETITQGSGWQANFSPVPEPSSLVLMVFGLAVVGFCGARQFGPLTNRGNPRSRVQISALAVECISTIATE